MGPNGPSVETGSGPARSLAGRVTWSTVHRLLRVVVLHLAGPSVAARIGSDDLAADGLDGVRTRALCPLCAYC